MNEAWAGKILLVDDDRLFRERLARALQARGCEVEQSADADEAGQLAETRRFSAAIVDLKLASGSGLDVIRRLRAARPGLRIVMLTGYGSIATALEAVRLGAADYVTKPADADEILARVRAEDMALVAPPAEAPSLARAEWEHLQRVLSDCDGNISRAARALGIDRRSLQRKLLKYPPTR
jgi:two-component system response regulator RegA